MTSLKSLCAGGFVLTSRRRMPAGGIKTAGIEGKAECGTLIHFSLGPNPPSMLFNNSLNCSQTHARSFEFVGAVEPLKHAKQLMRVFFVEAGAVVANEDNGDSVFTGLADLDDGAFHAAGVFHGVGQQVREYQFH